MRCGMDWSGIASVCVARPQLANSSTKTISASTVNIRRLFFVRELRVSNRIKIGADCSVDDSVDDALEHDII